MDYDDIVKIISLSNSDKLIMLYAVSIILSGNSIQNNDNLNLYRMKRSD